MSKVQDKIVVIPFSGFYDSWHSARIDYDVESWVEYQIDEGIFTDEEANDLDFTYTSELYPAYAKKYIEQFEAMLRDNYEVNVTFEFVEVESPKIYNYTTDKIIAKASKEDLLKLYDSCDKLLLRNIVKDNFSNAEGFISFYSANVDDWLVSNFDHNQWWAVLQTFVEHFENENGEPFGLYGVDNFDAMEYIDVSLNGVKIH